MQTVKKLLKTITAYAACESGAGCELCPLYKEEKQRTERGKCVNEITREKLTEALKLIAMIES